MVLENPFVRMLQTRYVPEQRIAPHTHPHRIVGAPDDSQSRTTADGRTTILTRKRGEVFWSGPYDP